MPATAGASRSQRQRWELGRWLLVRRHVAHLVAEASRRRSLVLWDLAADLLVPPLSYVVLAALVGSGASAAFLVTGRAPWWALVPWGLSLAGLAVYVARGVWLARVGPRVVLDLCCVPFYIVWKIGVSLRRAPARKGEWVRTARDGEPR
jgi:1,2-diacylglycerol 3-beta-glucosyltransferase